MKLYSERRYLCLSSRIFLLSCSLTTVQPQSVESMDIELLDGESHLYNKAAEAWDWGNQASKRACDAEWNTVGRCKFWAETFLHGKWKREETVRQIPHFSLQLSQGKNYILCLYYTTIGFLDKHPSHITRSQSNFTSTWSLHEIPCTLLFFPQMPWTEAKTYKL
jgi:hypothetical protein